MPGAKRQKIDREGTAAYITSQPLFDSLRHATKAVSDQKKLLKTARDTVQALHVKVINDDVEKHLHYTQCIVCAWLSAIEAYHDIFQQLSLITAADPATGREAAAIHAQVEAMLKTSRQAMEVAKSVWSGKVDAEDSDEEEVTKEEEDEEEVTKEEDEEESAEEAHIKKEPESEDSADSPPVVESSKPIPVTLPPNSRKRTLVEDDSAEEGAVNFKDPDDVPPQTTTDAQKKKAKKTAKSRRKAAKEAAAKEQAQPEPEPVAEDPAPPSPAFGFREEPSEAAASAPPTVEYENVDAEVEARVNAKLSKAARKKLKRAEMKRKRESVDSLAKDSGNEETTNMEPVPESKPIIANDELIAKPKKKKVKKSHIQLEDFVDNTAAKTDGGPSQSKSNSKAEKRKPDADTATGQGGGGKKRKTKHNDKA